MSLILPAHLKPADSISSHGIEMGTFYRLSDLTAQSVNVSDLIQILAKQRRSDFIKYLVLIMNTLNGRDGLKLQTQLQLAGELLEPDLMNRLLKHVRTPGVLAGSVFFDRQIYLLLQLVVFSSNESGVALEEQELKQAVGRCCLMVNDILHEIEPKDSPGKGPEQVNAWFAATVIPIHQRKPGFELLARARDFWFQIPAKPEVLTKLSKISDKSFADAFLEKYKVGLREYYLMLISSYMHFLANGSSVPLLLEPESYLIPIFKKEDVERLIQTISQNPGQLAVHLLSSPRQNWSFDQTPIRKYPLLEVFPGRHACIDQSIFFRSIVDKVYFMLQEAYEENKFGQMFGYIFEEYIISLLKNSVAGVSGNRIFFPNPHFEKKEDEAGDAILVKDGVAIVMEFKARLLTTHEKFCGNQSVTLRGVDHILAKSDSRSKKGVAQLAATLPRLLNGERIVSGHDQPMKLSDCHTIVPVIVTLEESVGFEAVRQIAESKFSKLLSRNNASLVKIGTLIILTVRDVEILEACSGACSPIDLIQDYAAKALGNPKHRAGDFPSYIGSRSITYDSDSRPSLTDQNQRLAMDEAMAELDRGGSSP